MNKIIVTENKTSELGDFYGIFFEDINHAADGGLYGELLRNRNFEFSHIDNPTYSGLTAWKEYSPKGATVSLSVRNAESASKANPHYLVMDVQTNGESAGVKNEGFNSGIPLYKGKKYKFSMRAAAYKATEVSVCIASADGNIYDSVDFDVSGDWAMYEGELTAAEDDFSAKLLIMLKKSGKIKIDFTSLFPKETFKNRENGMRCDIAEMLEALKPKFVRFPGGCLVHDGSLNKDDRDANYRWKNSIGDIKERPSRRNNWRYNQSLGLGYYEYFLFCEDIKAEPLPVLPAGYNPHGRQGVPLDEMQEWIDDALDLIEFANGSTDTKWGKVREELGHAEPFNMKYIGIGNEEVGQGFFDRYDIIHKAIREKYPEIKIINSAGPFNHGGEYDRGWENAKKNGSDIIDEHYYMTPEWLLANYHRYDKFSGEGTKVFLGEYASWDNRYYNALAEAAYMTGLENNAHAVALVCYAPLLCNVQYVNWTPDMIWFDNHRVCGSANYYVQKMFMNNLPTRLLETKKEGLDKMTMVGEEKICGGISLIADRSGIDFSDIKITDNETGEVTEYNNFSIDSGTKFIASTQSGHYTVEFKAKRTSGELGFKVAFAEKGDKDKTVWSIGGWENQDCIIDKFQGHASCLTQSRFFVETGVEYKLKLVVDGRRLMTYINDTKFNDVEDKIQINEELYYTAGIDENDGSIIVKAVNVNETAVKATITVPREAETGEVTELSGNEKDDKNSLEEPNKVFPKTYEVKLENGGFEFEFKPLSVYVFRIK